MTIVGYVGMFATLITNGEKLFPHIGPPYGPFMLLTLFCFSVLFCGLVVFYQPYRLFMEKKGIEAAELVLATAKWLGVMTVVVMTMVIYLSR